MKLTSKFNGGGFVCESRMARHIGTEVRKILEEPDPTRSASLVLVAEEADLNEVTERVKAAEGEVTRSLPDGVFIAEVPENKVEIICEGDLLDSISLDGRLQLA